MSNKCDNTYVVTGPAEDLERFAVEIGGKKEDVVNGKIEFMTESHLVPEYEAVRRYANIYPRLSFKCVFSEYMSEFRGTFTVEGDEFRQHVEHWDVFESWGPEETPDTYYPSRGLVDWEQVCDWEKVAERRGWKRLWNMTPSVRPWPEDLDSQRYFYEPLFCDPRPNSVTL